MRGWINMAVIFLPTNCPNCNNSDARLFEETVEDIVYASLQCYECGCIIQPAIFWQDLEQLNELRMDAGLPPMTEKRYLELSREFDGFVEG